MAKSGDIKTSGYKNRCLKFHWEITSQSVEENRTYYKWTLTGADGDSGTWYALHNARVDISLGSYTWNAYTQGSGQINLWSGTTVASGSSYWSHDDVGKLSLSVKIQGGIYTTAVNCTGTGTMAFTDIPRASSISSVSGTTIGDTMTVNIGSASSSFNHQLWYKHDAMSDWHDLGTMPAGATQKTFTIPMDTCNACPNATSTTLHLCLRTLKNTERIGSDCYKDVTVNVPSSVVPQIDWWTITDNMEEIANSLGTWVKGKSIPRVRVGASGAYGSTIQSCVIKIGNNTFASSDAVGNVIWEDTAVSAFVTDSRGRTSTQWSYTIPITDYWNPCGEIKSCERCNTDGSTNEDGNCLKVSFWYSIAPCNKTYHAVKLQYLKDDNWTDMETFSDYGTSGQTAVITNPQFDVNQSYAIRLLVSDFFSENSAHANVPTAFTLMNFNASGRGIGIGKVSEDDSLDIALPLKRSEKIDSGNIPISRDTDEKMSLSDLGNFPSWIGSVPDTDGTWHGIISARHRNGAGDGRDYGFTLYNNMTIDDTNDLYYFKQNGGRWQGQTPVITGSRLANNATTTSEGYALDARQGKAIMDKVVGLIKIHEQNCACSISQWSYKAFSVYKIAGYTPVAIINLRGVGSVFEMPYAYIDGDKIYIWSAHTLNNTVGVTVMYIRSECIS